MGNLLKTGGAWLDSQMRANAASIVAYARGGSLVSLAARKGKTVFTLIDDQGVSVRVEASDFIITTADLVIEDSAVLPERNDRITDEDGNVFVVLPFGDKPMWERSGSNKPALRIHTKLQERA